MPPDPRAYAAEAAARSWGDEATQRPEMVPATLLIPQRSPSHYTKLSFRAEDHGPRS
jgi:hypothetical protein